MNSSNFCSSYSNFHAFHADEEEYGNDEVVSDVDDEDLDDELGLPYVLANIGLKEKRELFQFKKTHTDVGKLTRILCNLSDAKLHIKPSFYHSTATLLNTFPPPSIITYHNSQQQLTITITKTTHNNDSSIGRKKSFEDQIFSIERLIWNGYSV